MKFWAIDSPVMRVLGRLGDIIILNMIFVVGCIPVITIGTSLSALYAVAMKMARGEDPSVWKEFWKAYKRNFRPATICWLVMAVIAILLFVDFRIIGVLKRGSESMYSIMRIVLAVILGMVFEARSSLANLAEIVGSSVGVTYVKVFFGTLFLSAIFSIMLAGLLLGLNLIAKNNMTFKNALCLASVRSIVIAPAMVVALIIILINPLWGGVFSLIINIWGFIAIVKALSLIHISEPTRH